jgi:hypothetical protein
MQNKTLPTQALLDQIKTRFYKSGASEKRYYQDRRMLLYALTWPATWLDRRGLPITSQGYEKLLTERLEDIAKHGNPKRYSNYFPRYLLKSIQDWFAHHGEALYEELKHIRNQLCGIEALLGQNTSERAEDIVSPMAEAHAILAAQNRRKNRPDTRQLNLL